MGSFKDRKAFWLGDIEITVREIICSITILSVMLVLGLCISNVINNYRLDKVEEYNKALKISDVEQFQHGMDTNVGNAFVYGELCAKDPVTYSELDDTYLIIKKTKEEYREHTRTVTYTDSDGNVHTKTETYWSWDTVGTEKQESSAVTFLGVGFPINRFNIPAPTYVTTIKKSSTIRYVYYGTPKTLTGTIYTKLENKDISNNSNFYPTSLSATVDNLTTTSSLSIVGFWILWFVLTGFLIFGFYCLENTWLY